VGLLIEQERRAWKRQPQTRQRLNPASPYFAGLLFHAPLHPGWGMLDLVSGAPCTKTGLGTSAATPAGVMPVFGSGSYADFTAPAAFDGSLPFTIAWVQQPISPVGYSTVLDIKPPVNAANSFLIYQSASDAIYQFVVGPRDGGGKGAQFATGLQTDRLLDVYVLVAPAGMASTTSQYALYRNGVRQAPAVANPAFGAANTAGFRIGTYLGGSGDPFEGCLGGVTIWQRALDDRAASAWLPAKLYSPRRTRRYIPTTGGGTTQVTSDLSAAYSVRGKAQSDLSAAYSVRGAVQSSLSASYTALGAVQADLSAVYSIQGSAQSDLAANYSVIGAVQSSLSASYAVLGEVQSSLSASYAVQGSAQADLAAAYSICGKAQADLAASYTVVAKVQSDLSASYTIIGKVQSDLAAAYSVRGAVQSELSASYEIQSAGVVISDMAAAYSILGTVTSDLSASYAVLAPVSSELAAEYVVRGAVATDLTANYRVLTPVVSDLSAAYSVSGSVTSDLAASWAVMGTATKDLAASYSIYSSSGGGTGASAQEIADAVWQRVVESGLTAEQMLRIIMAPLAGKADGIGTTTERYFAQDGVTPRVTATFDAQSNRISTTVNGTV